MFFLFFCLRLLREIVNFLFHLLSYYAPHTGKNGATTESTLLSFFYPQFVSHVYHICRWPGCFVASGEHKKTELKKKELILSFE